MENKTIYRPIQPNKPELLKLKIYYWTDLIAVDSWIIFGIAFFYWIHLLGAFESLEIYYLSVGITILIRLWPFIVTNSQIRNKNKRLIDCYDKEVVKYEKSLKEYYNLKTRMEVEQENRIKIEERRMEVDRQNWEKLEKQKIMEYEQQNSIEVERQSWRKLEEQKRMENERQNRIKLNIQKRAEAEQQNKIDSEQQNRMAVERQNLMNLEPQKKPVIKTPEEELKFRAEKLKPVWKSQPESNIKDTSIIKKRDNQIDVEVNNTIRNYSGICAALAIQPIPFADILILTPTQIIMGKKIADLRGYKINENTIESILKEIIGIIGLGIMAQQLLMGAYKTIIPFLGGITTIPAVYGLTYGIGKVMDYYILAKKNGTQINKSDIEKIFKSSREIGQREGKLKEKDILSNAKK